MKKIDILIVDDHKLFLEGEKLLIESSTNFNVKAFDCSLQAKKTLNIFCPDILITDISMPIINGLELIKFCRKKYGSKLKILVISSYENFLEDNLIDAYLHKSDSSERLISTVQSLANMNCLNSKKSITQVPYTNITKKEKEVIRLIKKGYGLEKIASSTFNSKHTIVSHKKNIYKKLDVHSVADLIKISNYLGIN